MSITIGKEYFYGEAVIKEVVVDDILADEISVLSSKRIFRRAKDIIDIPPSSIK